MKLKSSSILLLGVVMAACVCGEEQWDDTVSLCVKQKVTQLENDPRRSPAASITMIITPNKTYFYIPPYCCDFLVSCTMINVISSATRMEVFLEMVTAIVLSIP